MVSFPNCASFSLKPRSIAAVKVPSPLYFIVFSFKSLVDLDAGVNPPHKRIRREKADRARRQTVHCARQRGVTKEQQTAHPPLNVQPGGVVPRGVHKDPEARAAADQERLPPPVVVLGVEDHVRGDKHRLRDRDGEQRGDDAEEAKDVVVGGFIEVEGLEDEQELDEENREGDEAREEGEGEGVACVPLLRRDLSGEGARAGRVFPGR